MCVARERARREEAVRGGKGVGVRGDRDREEEGRARGVPRPRGTAAVAAAAVQGESPKRPRINNLPWEPGSACDGHIVVFCYRGFFVGDVVLINVFYSYLHTFRGGERSRASRAGDVAERAELGMQELAIQGGWGRDSK